MTMETEEEFAGVVLRPLVAEPLPSPVIDIERAIADGRRGHRRRRVLAVAAVVAVGALTAAGVAWSGHEVKDPSTSVDAAAASATPAPPSCRIEPLAVPGRDRPVKVTGMDPTGRFVLGLALPTDNVDGNQPSVIWDNGRPAWVQLPGTQQDLSDITTSGVAVGTYYQGGLPHPVVVRGGQVTALTGVSAGQVTAINDAGTIVGFNLRSAAATPVPVRWDSPTSPAVDLPLPAGFPYGVADAIAEDGTIIGTILDGHGATRAYIWPSTGVAHELPAPTGVDSVKSVTAVGGDWAIGSGMATGGGQTITVGVMWNLRTGEVTALPPGFGPRDIAGNGWIVGEDRTRHPGAGLLAGGRMVALPALADLTNDATNVVRAINADGRILAGWSDASALPDTTKPVLWRCDH